MSLNRKECAAAAREIEANRELAGISTEELRELTGLSPARFAAAYSVDGDQDPCDVWLVRDAVVVAVRNAGLSPLPFSKMREDMRDAANMWFGYERPTHLEPR